MANSTSATTSAPSNAAAALLEQLSPVVGRLGAVMPPEWLPLPTGVPGLPITSSSAGDLQWVLPEVAGFAERTGARTSGVDGAGGGFDADLAEWVAVAEAVERYTSTVYSRDQLIVAIADELGDEALDLGTLPRLSARELADAGHGIGPARKDLPRSWVRGVRMSDARLTWIPAELVWLFFDEPGVRPISAANSTGCAIHSDPWQAMLNSLLEVIERDAIRRCRTSCALPPSSLIGSFHANKGTPPLSSTRSTDKPSYIRRATRAVDSQITTSKRRLECCDSSRRSAMPPSRAIGMSNLS